MSASRSRGRGGREECVGKATREYQVLEDVVYEEAIAVYERAPKVERREQLRREEKAVRREQEMRLRWIEEWRSSLNKKAVRNGREDYGKSPEPAVKYTNEVPKISEGWKEWVVLDVKRSSSWPRACEAGPKTASDSL